MTRKLYHNFFNTLLLFIAILTSASSCQKDLYYPVPNTSVEMRFNWNGASPDPQSEMRLYVFPETGHAYTKTFDDYNGGEVKLPKGQHKAIALTVDEEVMYVMANKYETAMVTTNTTTVLSPMKLMSMTAAPRPNGTQNEAVKMQASQIFADTCSTMTIVEGENVIVMEPKLIVDTINITIRGIQNIEYLKASSAAISGLPLGFNLAKMEPIYDPCTMVTGLEQSGENSVSGKMVVFGRPVKQDNTRVLLTFYTVLADGSKYYFNFDVTETVAVDSPYNPEEPDAPQKNIEIIIEDVTLPEPTQSGGFNPQMGEWEEVHKEIMV